MTINALDMSGKAGLVTGAAVFLLSPAVCFITGQILHVDGGYTAQ